MLEEVIPYTPTGFTCIDLDNDEYRIEDWEFSIKEVNTVVEINKNILKFLIEKCKEDFVVFMKQSRLQSEIYTFLKTI